jgi:hypothetical protein
MSNQVQEPLKNELKRKFNYRFIVNNVPFFLFLALIAVLYIYNGHFADKLARKIATSEKNIKELQYEYKSIQSELIFRSKPSELIRAVEPLGLKELKQPPVRLDSTINNQ